MMNFINTNFLNGSLVDNQKNPKLPGHSDAKVTFEWKGVPHLKSSKSRTYWFDQHGKFPDHGPRNAAKDIMAQIKSKSGINKGAGLGGCCGGAGGGYGEKTNIEDIEAYMQEHGPEFEQKMAKHNYSIDWEFIERGLGYVKKESGKRRQKIRRYPHGWVFFFSSPGRNNSDRLRGGNNQGGMMNMMKQQGQRMLMNKISPMKPVPMQNPIELMNQARNQSQPQYQGK